MNYAPSDPEFRAPQGASLQFDIKTEVDETFTVMLHKNYWVDGFTSYAAKVDIAASPEWQTVKLAGTDFVDEKSDAVLGDSINEIGQLGLMKPKGQTWQDPKIIFRNFRWVGGQYVPHVHAYRNPKRTKVAKDRTDLGSDDAKNLVDHEAVKLDALITDLKFDSEHQYRLVPAGLKVGETLWTDRKLKVVSLPEGLVGADCLKTPMVDRSNRSEAIIKFTTKRNCTVYVGIKEGSENLPEWLSAWEATDEKVNAVNTLVLYRKRFSKDDRVTLGSIHRQGIHAMYTVFVKAE